MSRSVDYLSGAQAVAYLSAHHVQDGYDWRDFQEDITEQLKTLFPSLTDCDRWGGYYDGSENHIVLENSFCEIAIAEYCGLVSVSMRVSDYNEEWQGLAENWVAKAVPKFNTIGSLRKIGTFSNGEAIFTTKDKPEHTYTSKEGLCEWLEA